MKKQKKTSNRVERPRCGLCGKTRNLTKTGCCDQWICDDADQYVIFSFARNSCYRNHDRFTLCSLHYNEEHSGHWKDCKECRDDIETEMYVYYGTNEYNFEKLENPPDYEPTRCFECNSIIDLGYSSHSITRDGYLCAKCSDAKWPRT